MCSRRSLRPPGPLLVVALSVAGLLAPRCANGYAFTGYTWPDGTQIVMHLGLSHSPSSFPDGSGSWNASAADALSIWNQYLSKVHLVPSDSVPAVPEDGANSAFFANNVYGQTWGTGVLAVTLRITTQGSNYAETDVIFNNKLKWSSYRGPLIGSGPNGTYDFHRIALHEFGHVLGLDHPDQAGQSVAAIMNSLTSNLDQLADDDIAGIRSLYGQRITSNLSLPNLAFGQQLSYQIQADNNPTSFSAAGLPPGLQVDINTGLITGIPERSGVYNVSVTAYGIPQNAFGTLKLVVAAPRILSSTFNNAVLGSSFTYQITAENHPTSFDALNLRAGLVLDRQSGRITGVPTLSGLSSVTLIAHGFYEDASAALSLQVTAPATAAEIQPLSQFALRGDYLLADPARPRIYCGGFDGVTIIDSSTMTVVKTISGGLGDFSISPDGNTLWQYGFSSALLRIDLNSLSRLPNLSLPDFLSAAQQGLGDRLYVLTLGGNALLQLDANTGAEQVRIKASDLGLYSFGKKLALSPDRKSLYLGATLQTDPSNFSVRLCRFDVSSSTPVLQQTASVPGTGIASLLSGSTDNSLFVIPTFYGQQGSTGAPTSVLLYAGSDLTMQKGTFVPSGSPSASALSPDGKILYLLTTRDQTSSVELFDTATFRPLGRIGLGKPRDGSTPFGEMAIDQGGQHVIASFYPVNYTNSFLGIFNAQPPPAIAVRPKSLLNVSTRLRSQPGENVLIGGFIVTGDEPKKMIVRAVGTSLGLAGKLADPQLELHAPDGLVITNDNWNEHRAEVLASGVPPADEHESAIVATLRPGAYTAILRGLNNTSGVALVEVYDLSPTSNSGLSNLSTRGKVDTGDNVMIGGFIIGGDQATKVIVRAVGPSLANNGVAGSLSDTTLSFHDGNGTLIASNDDWQSDQAQEIIDSTVPPTDARESAIVRTLQPGNYTAIVRGKNETTGVALVEVFNLEH